MSETERRIKQIIPPTGDWFQIQIEHLGDKKEGAYTADIQQDIETRLNVKLPGLLKVGDSK
jgi:hypothetical protein